MNLKDLFTRAALELGAWTDVTLDTDKTPAVSVQALARICVWQQSQIEALQRTVTELSLRESRSGLPVKEDASDLRIPDCGSEPDDTLMGDVSAERTVNKTGTQELAVNVNVEHGVLSVWVGGKAHVFSLPSNLVTFGEAMHICRSHGIASTVSELQHLRQRAIDERAGNEEV